MITLTPTTPAETFADLKITATITGVTVAGKPVVNFKLADDQGRPIAGFGSTSKSSTATVASYPNLAFSLAKLVPAAGGSPSKWVSYIVTTVPTTTTASTLTRPSTDNTGTLVDNGDGTYAYTFYRDLAAVKAQVDASTDSGNNRKADLGDLTFDANLTHRATIQISGAAPGTGTNTPTGVQSTAAVNLKQAANVYFDFVPATGAAPAATAKRDVTTTEACNACHIKLGGVPGASEAAAGLAFHGSSRNMAEYCMVCHTDQRRYGRAESTADASLNLSGSTYVVNGRAMGDMPVLVHKTHLASSLALNNYNYAGVLFDQGGYSQDIRNCTTCHDGAKTAQGDNWKTKPSRVACGSCHDGINFDTGVGVTLRDAAAGLTSSTSFNGRAHPANATDAGCANVGCHGDVNGKNLIALYHIPVMTPNRASGAHVAGGDIRTNAAWLASNIANIPEGAVKVEYDIKSVSRDAATGNPVMVFRLLANGQPKALNDYATAALNPATGRKELWDGFMGAPGFYFAWSIPQDGSATAPADWNATASGNLRQAWEATGTGVTTTYSLVPGTGADEGYYVLTRTGTVIPTNAGILAGGLGYQYDLTSNQPFTQTNLAEYPVPDPAGQNPASAAKSGGLIVQTPNVWKTATNFTARRTIVSNDKCNACHANLGSFTEHGFHVGQRNDAPTCSWCHNTTRSNNGWAIQTDNITHGIHAGAMRSVGFNWHATDESSFADVAYPGVLTACETCHLPGTYDYSATASAAAAGINGAEQRQLRLVANGTVNPSVSTSPNVPADKLGVDLGAAGAGTNLVVSPWTQSCASCHDVPSATAHMEANGGTYYKTRTEALGKTEQCATCHGPGRSANIKDAHAK